MFEAINIRKTKKKNKKKQKKCLYMCTRICGKTVPLKDTTSIVFHHKVCLDCLLFIECRFNSEFYAVPYLRSHFNARTISFRQKSFLKINSNSLFFSSIQQGMFLC